MPPSFPGGPYREIPIGNGVTAPWFIVPFDKEGVCTAPVTRATLVAEVRSGKYTNIFIFSHGWNNDWETASARYDHFIDGYMKQRASYRLPMPDTYRPLLVGIIWPSTALVLPSEQPPRFAGAADPQRDAAAAQEER